MKVCTTGLIVRFFNVTIATGQIRGEKSTGNTLSEGCSAGAILSADHEIGNRSMHHPSLWRVSSWRLWNEVRACQDVLRSICAEPVRIESFRAPYGHFRWDLRFVKRLGLKTFVKWDVAPPCQKPDASAMAEYVLENTRPVHLS
jgi:peptidoglycan/xylan/chitin deacetylase (PgdA/CDA1 family)